MELGDLPVKPAKMPNMKPVNPAFLRHLIVFLLYLCSTVTLAVPKAADQEEDEVTFSEAGAPPKRTTQPYRSPAAGVATPSVRSAKSANKPARNTARLERGHRHGKRLVVASKPRQLGKVSSKTTKRAGNAPKLEPSRMADKAARTNARVTRFDQKRQHGARTAKSERRHSRATQAGSRTLEHAPVKPRRLEPRRTKAIARPAARTINRHAERAPARRVTIPI